MDRMGGQVWMDGWMDGWTDGWMDGWMDGKGMHENEWWSRQRNHQSLMVCAAASRSGLLIDRNYLALYNVR